MKYSIRLDNCNKNITSQTREQIVGTNVNFTNQVCEQIVGQMLTSQVKFCCSTVLEHQLTPTVWVRVLSN
ncbi:hypothetical protein M0802_008528 [Mischocyttarus mexicanus]|nr:hypothetical protein M0802_008528 [Mischocyttarus mexicanus]